MGDTLIQRSFASGEVAPSLYARVDQSRYQTGLRTMRNCTTMRAGGAQNRPGTTFVAEVKDSTLPVRLIPFIASSTDAYVLEFGDKYMRAHQNGEQVRRTPTIITGISNANPAVVTTAAHGYSNGDEVNIQGVIGMPQINQRNFKVAGVTTNTYQLIAMDGVTNINSTAYGTYVSGGTAAKVFELVTTYGWSDLPQLKYVQSNDVMSIVHPSYPPRKLSFTGPLSWSIADYVFAPSIDPPTSVSAIGGDSLAAVANYAVTAVSANGEESLKSAVASSTVGTPNSAHPVAVTWTAPAQPVLYYNVYRNYVNPGTTYTAGSYCLIGVVSTGTAYADDGHAASLAVNPPSNQNPFSGVGNYPSTVAYFQGRLCFASTNNNPETVWASVSGDYTNFTLHVVSQDDDMVQFTLNSKQISPVKHLVDLNRLLLLTSAGEYLVSGDANGVLTPSGVNPVQQSYYGSSDLQPLLIGNSALFVQARGAIIRDIGYEFYVSGYKGTDLTVFSTHLFDGYLISDWAYQQIPGYNVWAVRADGKLLGLTYVKDQEMVAWHRHDTEGFFENVACIPEGFEDAVYVLVNRLENGTVSRRYIERFHSRLTVDNLNHTFMDSTRTYGVGSGLGSGSLTLSGGTSWDYTETLQLTASVATFLPENVGEQFQLTGSDGTVIRFTVTAYTSSTVVSGKANKTVPAALRNTATFLWAQAIQTVYGLWHLEGRQVSVLADGFVVGSPNNPSYPVYTVTNGSITLDKPYARIYVGLPYISDLETLDIDTVQGQSIDNKNMLVSQVTLRLDQTRGVWVGDRPPTDDTADALEGLTELKLRDDEDYDDPTALVSRKAKVNMQSNWNANGRVFVRQVDPLPMTILSISPSGNFPMGGV